MNSLLFYVFVILSVMVGVLAERGIRGKAGSLITGFAAGTCIILAAVNLYFRNWISVILVVALFFWLPKSGAAISKLIGGKLHKMDGSDWIYLLTFAALVCYEIYGAITAGAA